MERYQFAIDLLIWFVFYFALLQLSSVAICGWYATTRGQKIKEPDNREKKVGKLLKSWYFFWFMEYPQKKEVKYEGKQLRILVSKLMASSNGVHMNVSGFEDGMFSATRAFLSFKEKFEEQLGLKFIVVENPSDGDDHLSLDIRVFEVTPHYIFPDWVRDMMAGCITCHASFYGSVIFWTLYAIVGKWIWMDVYSPFDNYWLGVIFTWLAYTFSLAYLNTVKYRKF